MSEVTCWNKWNDDERILRIPTGVRGNAGVIWYRTESGYSALKLGFDSFFNPVCQFGGTLQGLNRNTQLPREYRLQLRWTLTGYIKTVSRSARETDCRVWVLDIVRVEANQVAKCDCDGYGLVL